MSQLSLAGLVLCMLAAAAQAERCLNVLHFSDGEGHLQKSYKWGEGMVYGFSSFASHVQAARERHQADSPDSPQLLISAGDNFLPGPVLAASQHYNESLDATVLNTLKLDATALGNHEFDHGTAMTAEFVSALEDVPVLAANLDFSGVPEMETLVQTDVVRASTVIEKDGVKIGLIGIVTEDLHKISNPGKTVVTNVKTAVQAEADKLTADGVDIVLVAGHLQDPELEIKLAQEVTNVDVVIAGGGAGLADTQGYPVMKTAPDGKQVAIVNVNGGYKELGELKVCVGADGTVISATGQVISTMNPSETVTNVPGQDAINQVLDKVDTFLDEVDGKVLGATDILFDSSRKVVRGQRCAIGALAADAHVSAFCDPSELNRNAIFEDCAKSGHGFCADHSFTGNPCKGMIPIGHQNGGGIRADRLLSCEGGVPCNLTYADLMEDFPFENDVSVAYGVTAAQLKGWVEHGNKQGSGSYGQWSSNLRVIYSDESYPNNTVLALEVRESSGAWKRVDNQNDKFIIATNSFILAGGDGYPALPVPHIDMNIRSGVLPAYAQSVADYIQGPLNGVIGMNYYDATMAKLSLGLPADSASLQIYYSAMTEGLEGCTRIKSAYQDKKCCPKKR